MLHKDQWVMEHEQACEDFASGEIDEDTFTARMKALGFDIDEIMDEAAAIKGELV